MCWILCQRAAAGSTEPSPAARLMTTRLYSAGEVLGARYGRPQLTRSHLGVALVELRNGVVDERRMSFGQTVGGQRALDSGIERKRSA